jgi:hypothetical protein
VAVREHKLGEGTLAYRGESAEYWQAKAERLPRGRTRITRRLLAAGAVVAVLALSPFGPHPATARVLAVHPPIAGATFSIADVRVAGEDGTRALQVPQQAQTPQVGDRLDVTTMPGGRAVYGRHLGRDAWALAGLLLLVGAGRLIWQRRLRGTVIRFR